MPLVWMFCDGSLLLSVILSLSVWGWCVVMLSGGVLDYLPRCLQGFSIYFDCRWTSLLFSHGFGLHTPYCLDVSFLLPLIARRPLPLCFVFALWFCRPMAFLLTCLSGDVDAWSCVAVVGSHFCWAVVSARVMPSVGHFVSAPSYCVSSPLYILGVGHVLPLDVGFLAD